MPDKKLTRLVKHLKLNSYIHYNAIYACILLIPGLILCQASKELILTIFIVYLTATCISIASQGNRTVYGLAEAAISHVHALIFLIPIAYISIYIRLPFLSILTTAIVVVVGCAMRLRTGQVRPFSMGVYEPDWKVVLTAAIYAGPLLLVDYWMGFGTYPSVFFGPDTPFYLTHVFEIVRDPNLPPQSLWMGGERIAYHYGLQSATAMLAASTGLPPHNTLFLVVAPILHLGLVGIALRLSEYFKFGISRWLGFSIVLWGVIGLSTAWNGISYGHSIIIGQLSGLQNLFFNNSYFHYEMFNTNLAVFMVSSSALFLLNSRAGFNFTAPVMSPLLLLIKPQAFFVLIPGVCASFCYRFLLKKKPIHSALIFFVIGTFSACSVLLLMDPRAPSLTLAPLKFWKTEWRTMAQELLFYLLLIVVFFHGKKYKLRIRLAPVMIGLGASYFFISVFTIKSGLPDDSNILQVFRYTPLLLGIASVVVCARRYNGLVVSVYGKYLSLSMASATYSRLLLVVVFLFRPHLWHGYVNNDELAGILKLVDNRDAVLAVNDIRYPSENYLRKERQVQYPAIYGQEFYMSDPFDAIAFGYRDVVNSKMELYHLLQNDEWDARLDRRLSDNPQISHLLIHKNWPHPKMVPHSKTGESENYVLYKLYRHKSNSSN